MGDEYALAVDDVRVTGLTHLDLGHHIPDELEVHLRGDDTAGVGLSQRNLHVRFRFAAEVHRAEVRRSPG
ncbi:MAG TPA: hypothetical protein VFB50_19345, partial [Chloroflexota bacterium]|nr:hypothetical protein [Chloroflexota bacterium]